MARVTVVDDNEDFLGLMRDVLEMNGHQAHALKGRDATLDGLARTRPDVLFVDLRLEAHGTGHGWSLLREARSHPALRHVPIVLCTADHDFLRERGGEIASIGKVYTLTKPFHLDAVEILLGELLGGR